jgi:folate-binding Fe-S cluster repair protein YgfZ
LDWLTTAVHLNKGCYRGQETVAKVHNLGAPPRKLVFLHLDGSGHLLPQPGAEISSGEVIGKITSVASHFQAGPIALGLVKRNFKGGTVEVKLEDGSLVSATLEEIVPSDAGGVVDLGEFRKPRA